MIAGDNLYQTLGERDGIIALLDECDAKDTKANALRDLLMSDAALPNADGKPAMTFAKMYTRAGYSAKEIVELFANRKNAEAVVTALASKPRMVAELVDAASVKIVPCFECGGTGQVAETDDDGEWKGWTTCTVAHEPGTFNVKVYGDKQARELYFDQFGFKQSGPGVLIDNRQDNRSVAFTLGAPGAAPSALSMIRALEQVPDVDRKVLPAAPDAAPLVIDATVVEAEKVEVEKK